MTFAQEIEDLVPDGETIEAVVLGDDERGYREHPKLSLEVLTWEQARPLLDYDYDPGYGGQDCHSFYAWTQTRVIFVHEYDGATAPHWVPRHPAQIKPEANGASV